MSGNWGSGNEAPMAALVVGNIQKSSSTSYPYSATVNLSNVTVNSTGSVPAIYAASCQYDTTITGAADSDTILAHNSTNTANITKNGTVTGVDAPTLITVSDLSSSADE